MYKTIILPLAKEDIREADLTIYQNSEDKKLKIFSIN